MHCTIVDEAFTRLRETPRAVTTLSRLERDLGQALGSAPIGADRLRERLLSRPDLFRLIDAGPLPWPAETWPAEARERYRRALAEAGFDPEPVVALATPRHADDEDAEGTAAILHLLDATLVALVDEAPEGSPDEATVAQALAEARALRAAFESATEKPLPGGPPPRRARSTTPPPDPRRGG